MQRRREIAAAPIRSASDAWSVLTTLLADTLERNDAVPKGSVVAALSSLAGLGPALIAGGHLEKKGLVLVDEELHVTITVKTADAALEVEENLSPIPGGASATDAWVVYLPSAGPLDSALSAAAKRSPHLSTAEPPGSATNRSLSAGDSLIDLDALRSLGTKS